MYAGCSLQAPTYRGQTEPTDPPWNFKQLPSQGKLRSRCQMRPTTYHSRPRRTPRRGFEPRPSAVSTSP